MRGGRTGHRGFTLIEILIVVIILGILAGITFPQFFNATTAAKTSAVQSTAGTLRSAIGLYQVQHSGKLPGTGAGSSFASNQFWIDMTTQTDDAGHPYTITSTTGPFGPYMQQVAPNVLNSNSTVIDASVIPGSSTPSSCGFEYDWNGGVGSGAVHGTGTDGLTVLP